MRESGVKQYAEISLAGEGAGAVLGDRLTDGGSGVEKVPFAT